MNAPATQKPTPEERVDRFKRLPVISIIVAIAIGVLGTLTYSNKLIEQWDKAWARWHPKTYDVILYLAWQTGMDPATGLPSYWRVDDMNAGEQPYCPIGYVLTLSITNLQQDPMTIVGYDVYEKEADGSWTLLPKIPLEKYQHLYSTVMPGGLSTAVQIEPDPPPLDQQLSTTATLRLTSRWLEVLFLRTLRLTVRSRDLGLGCGTHWVRYSLRPFFFRESN